ESRSCTDVASLARLRLHSAPPLCSCSRGSTGMRPRRYRKGLAFHPTLSPCRTATPHNLRMGTKRCAVPTPSWDRCRPQASERARAFGHERQRELHVLSSPSDAVPLVAVLPSLPLLQHVCALSAQRVLRESRVVLSRSRLRKG